MPDERAERCAQQKEAQDEQDVVQSLRHDVIEAYGNIADKGLPRRRRIAASHLNRATGAAALDIAGEGVGHALLAQDQRPGAGRPSHCYVAQALGGSAEAQQALTRLFGVGWRDHFQSVKRERDGLLVARQQRQCVPR